ncbi:unnamed protein product [Calypogeia fissa]
MESKRGMSSASIAAQLRNQELERKLAEMEGKGGTSGMSSKSIAIQLRNQELERKLAEMEGKGGTSGMSSKSIAIQLRNQELERTLAETERKGGSSSATAAVQQRNQELQMQLAALERSKAGGRMPGDSFEVHKRLGPGRSVSDSGKSGGMSSASIAVQLRNQELERQLVAFEKGKSGLSSGSRAVHEKNQELERKKRNDELEKKFVGTAASKGRTDALSAVRQAKVNERVILLRKLIAASQELDLVFLVDVTGSMQPFIDSVKEKAPSIAAGVKKAWPKLKLRVAFVPYRDYEDSARDKSEMCDFTNDFSGRDSVFVQALSRVHADGGFDEAEDVFSGLERVTSLSWKSRTRVLVHIGDAPCHGRQFHDLGGEGDRCPEGDLKKRDISTLLRNLRDDCQIISYLFCHVNNTTKKMLRVFKKSCDDENWIQEEKLSNIEFLNERATQIKYKLPDSLEDLFHALATGGKLEMEDMPDSTVQIAYSPFSREGSLRWPYYALVHQPPSAPRTMVVKRFKATLGQDVKVLHAKEAYFEQMEVQTVAAKMAVEFNKVVESHLIEDYKPVTFTLVSTLRVGTKFYNMEKLLTGRWIRYSNNLNYVNTKEYAETLHAFSHWTYHRSKGLLVVNDLQGVEIMGTNGCKEFWLCDPAVHCTDAIRYEKTKTNWSEPGMKRFLEAHECNYICTTLRLPPTRRV